MRMRDFRFPFKRDDPASLIRYAVTYLTTPELNAGVVFYMVDALDRIEHLREKFAAECLRHWPEPGFWATATQLRLPSGGVVRFVLPTDVPHGLPKGPVCLDTVISSRYQAAAIVRRLRELGW